MAALGNRKIALAGRSAGSDKTHRCASTPSPCTWQQVDVAMLQPSCRNNNPVTKQTRSSSCLSLVSQHSHSAINFNTPLVPRHGNITRNDCAIVSQKKRRPSIQMRPDEVNFLACLPVLVRLLDEYVLEVTLPVGK